MFVYKVFRKFYLFLALLAVIVLTGTVGYMTIEGWGFFDAAYMTVITITTVGFGEVHPLSAEGRIFTAVLIISCFGAFAYSISVLTNYIVEGEYKANLREFKVGQKVRKMEKHVIICGYGRVGKQVADDLKLYEQPFVVIEQNEQIINENSDDSYTVFIQGDATHDAVLDKAGIGKAKALISCLPKDADNVYVVLAARQFNKELAVIARASAVSAVSKIRIAGADFVIMPDSIGGSHMAALINSADVIEFMDAIKVQGKSGVNIESISFSELPEEFRNKTIGELEAKRITGATIIGFKTPSGEYIINPDMDLKVIPDSKLFVLGSADQINKLNEHFGIHH